MQFIKYCMLFCVFVSSALVGKYVAQKYKYRLEELEEIKNALNIFKSKIRFTYEPIPEIFEQISQKSCKNVSNLFNKVNEKMKKESSSVAWEMCVEEFSGNLNKEDKQAIKSLSKLLRYNRYGGTIESNRGYRKFFR